MQRIHMDMAEQTTVNAVAVMKNDVFFGASAAISAVLLAAFAWGQPAQANAQTGAGAGAATEAAIVEELDLSGMSRAEIQREIERAREALLSRFNEINTDPAFETQCRERQMTGSKLSRVECQPEFVERANRARGRQRLQALQGFTNDDGNAGRGMGVDTGLEEFGAQVQMDLMGDEMKRLINEDDEFRALAARLGQLQQALAVDVEPRAGSSRTSAVIASAQDTDLPYDAKLMAEVSMGRNAWEHTLINDTFAIGHLYGEIDSMLLRCAKERTRFEYSLDAEWTVPAGWEDCRLTVDAPRGTTFTLFEFD